MTALTLMPSPRHATPLRRAVAKVLTRRRELLGLTVRELAAQSGFAPSTIQNWLSAKRAIDMDDLTVLCETLQVDPAAVVIEAQRLAGWE